MYSIKIFIKEFDMNKEQFNRMKNGNGFILKVDKPDVKGYIIYRISTRLT